MVTSSVPDWLTGLWRRLSIETGEGQRDTETQVFYLQTPTCFGDLRIPIDRPDLRQASFASLSQTDALALSRQQGFAGIAQVEQNNGRSYCQWMRHIDYQPPQPVRDIGLLYWENGILIEEGVDQVYREEWQKVDDGSGDFAALVLAENGFQADSTWQASLVVAGDHFVYSQNRSSSLDSAPGLSEYLTHPETAQKQQDYLSCEISYGRCRSGQVPWEIQRSTIPWREGTALWSLSDLVIDLENRRVMQKFNSENHQENVQESFSQNSHGEQRNRSGMRQWQIWEWGTGNVFKTAFKT